MVQALGILLALVLRIGGQQDFDALQARVDSLLSVGEPEIQVALDPGIYFFREGHLRLSGVNASGTGLILSGKDAYLVGADEKGEYSADNGYVDLDALRPVDVRDTVKRALGWPVPCLFRKGLYKIRCKEPDLSPEEASNVQVILSQWFVGAVYPVEKIRRGYLYFRKTESCRTGMWSELRFGRCRPRYILCKPVKRTTLHAATASSFLSLENCRLRSITLRGLVFLGNGDGNPLLDFRGVLADSVRVDSCRFEGVKSQVVMVDSTNHIRLRDNLFRGCYRGAVRLSSGTGDAMVEGNRFIDNGLQMTNAPIVDCKGKGFRVRGNYFEDFSYSAVGVGLHFSDSTGCVTSGVVEDNEICMSEAFRTGVPRELIDGGAIYVWTQNKDVAIRDNFIHDIEGPHGNRGIFADDGAVNVDVSGNLLLNISGGKGIDLRRAFRVERKRKSMIRRVNVGNRMEGNILDGRYRFYVRKGDPTSFKGENILLPDGYDRGTVVREWKNRRR